jgi:hypothetical protein
MDLPFAILPGRFARTPIITTETRWRNTDLVALELRTWRRLCSWTIRERRFDDANREAGIAAKALNDYADRLNAAVEVIK